MFRCIASILLVLHSTFCISKNISFGLYRSVQLPIPLQAHISVFYNEEIHIVAGYNAADGTTVSKNAYIISNISGDPSYQTISISNSEMPPITTSSTIKYWSECYTLVDDMLYLMMGGISDSSMQMYLVRYNLSSKSFTNSKYLQETLKMTIVAPPFYPTSCVFYKPLQYIYGILSPNVAGSALPEYRSILYDIMDHTLTPLVDDPVLHLMRSGFSCGIATNNYQVFMFGGTIDNNHLNLIEKWNLITNRVTMVDATLIYPRSFFAVSVTKDDYFIMSSGADASLPIEIFDATNEVMLDIDDRDIHYIQPPMLSNYAMFFDENNNMVINGGYNENMTMSNDMRYISMDDVFDVALIVSQDASRFSCVTTLQTEILPGDNIFKKKSIGDYVYAETNQLLLRLSEPVSDAEIYIGDAIIKIRRKSVATAYTISGSTPTYKWNVDLSVEFLWFSWKSNNVFMSGMPILAMGLGDTFDENEILVAASIYEFIFDNTPKIKVHSTAAVTWTFYHDECDLQINTNTLTEVNIGDYVTMQFDLMDATLLNTVLRITSDDIVDLDHELLINENETCVSDVVQFIKLCNPYTGDTVQVEILISDLSSYDINNNEYHIYFNSITNTLMLNNNSYSDTLTLYRNIMDVEVQVVIDSRGIYRGSWMMMYPVYNNESSQPNSTISILFDDALSFDGTVSAKMMIDFYQDECIIEYDGNSIDCYNDSIMIPKIEEKIISENEYKVEIKSSDVNVIGETIFKLNRRIQNISLNISKSLYLGEAIEINPYILDEEVLQERSSITVYSQQHSISYIVHLSYTTDGNILCEIEPAITQRRQPCDSGIPFQTTNISLITNEIQLTLQSTDTLLDEYNIHIAINHCPLGQGVNVIGFSCSECPLDAVNIWTNSQCFECNGISGIQCLGASDLKVSFNHWVAINQNEYAFDFFQDEHISLVISTFCPSGFCCNDINGCYWRENHLCADNRDPNSPLCGSCIEGFSEVFGSTSCQRCVGDRWDYLLVPFLVAILVVSLLIVLDPKPNKAKDNTKEINYAIYLLKDDLKSLQISLLRPLLYFFQGISFVTIQNGLYFYLTPMIQVLSFDFLIESDSSDAGICFLKDMNSMEKELWSLFFPLCMAIALFIIKTFYYILKYICCKNMERINFGWNAVWSILLILIGNIVSKMMKLLACSKIGAVFVHFYAGYMRCFGDYYVIALLSIVGIIIFWMIVWYLLWRMGPQKRDSRSSYLRTLTKPYKLDVWCWEFVMLSRRLLVSFFATFQYVANEYIQYILIILLVMYLVIHVHYKPFQYKRINILETLCIVMLIVCLLTINIFESDRNKAIMMSVVVLSPILLFIFYFILCIVHYFAVKNGESVATKSGSYLHDDDKISKRIKNMRHRLTASQQIPFAEADDTQFKDKPTTQPKKGENIHVAIELADVAAQPIDQNKIKSAPYDSNDDDDSYDDESYEIEVKSKGKRKNKKTLSKNTKPTNPTQSKSVKKTNVTRKSSNQNEKQLSKNKKSTKNRSQSTTKSNESKGKNSAKKKRKITK